MRAALRVTGTAVHGSVVIYTHWRGRALPTQVRDGLVLGWDRWHDMPYLTRILFERVLDSAVATPTTGYGICGVLPTDIPAASVIDINVGRGTVCIGAKTVSFYDYVNHGTTCARWPDEK